MPAVLAHWLVAQEVALKYIHENIKGQNYFEFQEGDVGDGFNVINPKEKVWVKDEMKDTLFYHMQQYHLDKDLYISRYVFLGANGPDVPYFFDANPTGKIFGKPGKSRWADYFHYNKQAEFLIELIKKALTLSKDYRKQMRVISYALGHATHLAADAIVHPYVNLIAGAYHDQVYADIHKTSECHQDSWLAQKYFGRKGINYDPSWTGYLPSPGVPLWNQEIEDVLICLSQAINTSYGEIPEEYLKTSYRNFYDYAIDKGYDGALGGIPAEPNPALVHHAGLKNSDYVDYITLVTKKAVEAAFYACESVLNLFESLEKARNYPDEENNAINTFRSELRNWNMDTGYWIDVDMNENGHPRITWRHSWCRD